MTSLIIFASKKMISVGHVLGHVLDHVADHVSDHMIIGLVATALHGLFTRLTIL